MSSGGSGMTTTQTSTPDAVYNKGLLTMQQAQWEMSQRYDNLYMYGPGEMKATAWDTNTGQATAWDYQPTGGASVQALEQADVESALELQPMQTELERAILEENQAAIQMRAPVRAKFYEETEKGLDVGRRTALAEADVTHAYDKAGQSVRNEAFRNNVDPMSGRYDNLKKNLLLGKAKDTAVARTTARTTAEDTNWQRLGAASAISSDMNVN